MTTSNIDSEEDHQDDLQSDLRCSNLYSEAELFRTMLDYIAEILPTFGLREDHYFEDARLFLYLVACGIAAYSAYYHTLESHRLQVAFGVAAFFGLLSLGFVLEIWGNHNSMMAMTDAQGMRYYIYGDLNRSTNNLELRLARRKPTLSRFLYRVRLSHQLVDEKSASVSRYVGKYFFESGRLNCQEVMESVSNMTDSLGLPTIETRSMEKPKHPKGRSGQPRSNGPSTASR